MRQGETATRANVGACDRGMACAPVRIKQRLLRSESEVRRAPRVHFARPLWPIFHTVCPPRGLKRFSDATYAPVFAERIAAVGRLGAGLDHH